MLEEKIDTLVATLENLISVLERSPTSAPKEAPAAPVKKKPAAAKKVEQPAAEGPNRDALLALAVDLSRAVGGVEKVQSILTEAVGHPKIKEYSDDMVGTAYAALKKAQADG